MKQQTKENILTGLSKAISDAEDLAQYRKTGLLSDDEFIKKAEKVGKDILASIEIPQMQEFRAEEAMVEELRAQKTRKHLDSLFEKFFSAKGQQKC